MEPKTPSAEARYAAFLLPKYLAEKSAEARSRGKRYTLKDFERDTKIKKATFSQLVKNAGAASFGMDTYDRVTLLLFDGSKDKYAREAREWVKGQPRLPKSTVLLETYLEAHFSDPRVRDAVLEKPRDWSPRIALHADRMARQEEFKDLSGDALMGIAKTALEESRIVRDDSEFGLRPPPALPPMPPVPPDEPPKKPRKGRKKK